jgi:AraC-like DNA-binding protein/quercetin dioxygenase-like cupin family protein
MSPDGQPDDHGAADDRDRLPTGISVSLAAHDGFGWHDHPKHQLAWVSTGVLVMAVGTTKWVLPKSRALLIPAGVRHSVATVGATTMLSLYLDPAQSPVPWTQPAVVDASPLLSSLGAHLILAELPAPARARAEAVMWDLLTPTPVTVLATPLPSDDRAGRVADALQADVTDDRTLADWGREVGASARTLARLFSTETGMGFQQWRTRTRLAAALPLLASGCSVTTVARRVGYESPSAFVAAFHREIGTTPADYFSR